jgi:hypothetical protein
MGEAHHVVVVLSALRSMRFIVPHGDSAQCGGKEHAKYWREWIFFSF